MYRRILLAYDGSAAGQKALLDCHEIAEWSHASLTLIAVMALPLVTLWPESGVYDETVQNAEKQRYQAILDDGVRRLADAGLTVRGEVVIGDAVTEIANASTRIEADLIVVGHKHLDGWAARWWRGSVSKALIEQAPCSVLVVITR
ncbi:Nucleotide-binding universal stress protein, UspA family [Polaromonas sp. OV174]|uniref:universal stress protein n=1 Tax=Polaromonas sp. OV174 TaxID=1855300 RepID=UPI0008EECBF4|nr:universal stress protein [Polaromonas sp. OV174]SFC46377.1 Nucleotide-binding universal stress protein, UspA family [Polaromonas sp. OV174]